MRRLFRSTGKSVTAALAMASLLTMTAITSAAPPAKVNRAEPHLDADTVRIAIECEDMQGVAPASAIARDKDVNPTTDPLRQGTPKWTFGRWGHDLYQNMVFGGVWASRMAAAITDPSDAPSEVYADITVPVAQQYKVWAKYESPPFYNYPFGIRIEKRSGAGKDAKVSGKVFEKVYGLRNAAKHFCFTDKLTKGDLYCSWGMDHDAAEGYEVPLEKGDYRVTLYKTTNPDAKANPGPTAGRSVDTILITEKITDLSSPMFPRYPLLDELQRANHVYIRFKNQSDRPLVFTWDHWNHRYNHFYAMSRELTPLVRFYGADGTMLTDDKAQPLVEPNGQWKKPVPPGEFTPWIDAGPTMTTESNSPFSVLAHAVKGPAGELEKEEIRPGNAFAMDIALSPSDKAILKSLESNRGTGDLHAIVQPDLHRREGVEWTLTTTDVYRRMTAELEKYPRVGPAPKKLRLYGGIGSPRGWGISAKDPQSTEVGLDYGIALGLNTVQSSFNDTPAYDLSKAYFAKRNWPLVEPSGKFHHTTDPEAVRKLLSPGAALGPKGELPADVKPDPTIASRFHYVSFGDEIGLPSMNLQDEKMLAAFREYLTHHQLNPQDLGFNSIAEAKPLARFNAAVAVQIGVIPPGNAAGDKNAPPPPMPTGDAAKTLRRLYWHTLRFNDERGIADFAEKTVAMTKMVGPHFKTSANLGGMHPFYWMHQASFIESFKGKGMTLAWSEDYDYCQPEASRLVIDFQAAYLRAGAKYLDTPMMFYNMPHWPGNSGTHLLQNAVTLWGQGIQDLDFFNAGPDIWATENYISCRGGVAGSGWAMRRISGMAGNVEDALIPARTRKARVAVLLSEASDVWELQGESQGAVAPAADGKPASQASNASQEERKAIWNCLRRNGYLVDLLTENDVKDGYLKDYKALYVCGHNLERHAATTIKKWVENGGSLYMTCGAARKDEFDEPLDVLDSTVGRGNVVKAEYYRGPLRAKMELLFLPSLSTVQPNGKPTATPQAGAYNGPYPGMFDAIASREQFLLASGSVAISSFNKPSGPALTLATSGKGTGYYIGTLPGQAYIKKAMRVQPMGKGGPESNASQFEPYDFDAAAAKAILLPLTNGGIKPDFIAPLGVVCNILDGPKATVMTVINLARQHAGKLKDVSIQLPQVPPTKKAITATKTTITAALGNLEGSLVLTLSELDDADVIVLER